MPELMPFEEVQRLFTTLGVRNFGAALPEGRIHWMDESGAVVAHARCAALLSWAAANRSVYWAEALAHFKTAGVPTVPRPEGLPEYQEGMTEQLAESLAARAAQDVSAEFLYTAPTGGGGKLYLAVMGFTPGADQDEVEPSRKVTATRAWVEAKLRQLGQSAGRGDADTADLLRAFAEESRRQSGQVVQGTDLAPALIELAADLERWAAGLPDANQSVSGALAAAARGFGTMN